MKYDEYPLIEYSISHLENDVGFMTKLYSKLDLTLELLHAKKFIKEFFL